MSILSELKKRAGPRVSIRAARPVRFNSTSEPPKTILLRATEPLRQAFETAHLLVERGVPVRTARAAIDDLAAGRPATVELPVSDEMDVLGQALSVLGIHMTLSSRRTVDVKALRARLGISQEAFAGRYGIDVATLRNWEQGRATPDGPAATLLQLIDRDPDKIVELLAS